jgi:2'-5' RNA ligase
MRRVFIAINLSQNVKDILRDILEKLAREYRRAPIRFVKPDGFHITLHFLGNQNDEMIEKLKRVLDEMAKDYKKTKLALDGFGFFSNAAQPRVLWLGTEEVGNRAIEDLQKNLGKELLKLGLEIDTRDWHPHITLGRISGQIDTTILDSIKVPSVEWVVRSIELIQSDLKPEGVEYRILYSAKLS